MERIVGCSEDVLATMLGLDRCQVRRGNEVMAATLDHLPEWCGGDAYLRCNPFLACSMLRSYCLSRHCSRHSQSSPAIIHTACNIVMAADTEAFNWDVRCRDAKLPWSAWPSAKAITD